MGQGGVRGSRQGQGRGVEKVIVYLCGYTERCSVYPCAYTNVYPCVYSNVYGIWSHQASVSADLYMIVIQRL